MSLTDYLAKIPLWFWLILILGASILIWIKLNYSQKALIKKILKSKYLFMVIFVVVWVIWHYKGAIISIHQSTFWMIVIGLGILNFYNLIGMINYHTRQIITPNFHASFGANPLLVNGFVIIGCDNFQAFEYTYPASRILVLREETFSLLDEGAISISRVSPASAYELPPEVNEAIEKTYYLKGGAKNHIYYGWFDEINRIDYEFEQLSKLKKEQENPYSMFNLLKEELEVDNPKISSLLWLYRNLCKAVNKQSEYYDATIDAVEKGVEHNVAVKTAYDIKPPEYRERTKGYEES